jgi:hypothetical protein
MLLQTIVVQAPATVLPIGNIFIPAGVSPQSPLALGQLPVQTRREQWQNYIPCRRFFSLPGFGLSSNRVLASNVPPSKIGTSPNAHRLALMTLHVSPARSKGVGGRDAKAILMAAKGLRNDQIADRVSLPRQIISKWRKRFFEGTPGRFGKSSPSQASARFSP